MNNKVLITQNVKNTLTIRYKYTYAEGLLHKCLEATEKITDTDHVNFSHYLSTMT